MYAVKMNADKTLSRTSSSVSYMGENLADRVLFLLPKKYDIYTLKDCVISLNIIDQYGNTDVKTASINTENNPYILTIEDSIYPDYLSFYFPITNELTTKAGNISFWINILNVENEAIIKTNKVSIPITEHIETNGGEIPEQELSLLDQWLVAMNQTNANAQEAVETAQGFAEQTSELYEDIVVIKQDIDEKYIIMGEYEQSALDSKNASKTSEDKAKISEDNAKDSENKAKISEDNAKDSENKAKISEDNAKDSENKAKISEDNAKDSENKALEQAEIATTQAGISTEKANSASLNKDATDSNKTATEIAKNTAEQKASMATEQALLSEYYANIAVSVASSIPMRYYRQTEEQMEAIANPVQGDLCYVVLFEESRTKLYVYDTTDFDANNSNPEWVFLGYLDFASLDRDTLLEILQLHPVALSGSYNDLINKPKRYESFITLSDGNWDYSLSDKAILSISATLNITNVYNGAIGLLIAYVEPTLPSNSKYSHDFGYLDGDTWQYSFLYDGTNFIWSRVAII